MVIAVNDKRGRLLNSCDDRRIREYIKYLHTIITISFSSQIGGSVPNAILIYCTISGFDRTTKLYYYNIQMFSFFILNILICVIYAY